MCRIVWYGTVLDWNILCWHSWRTNVYLFGGLSRSLRTPSLCSSCYANKFAKCKGLANKCLPMWKNIRKAPDMRQINMYHLVVVVQDAIECIVYTHTWYVYIIQLLRTAPATAPFVLPSTVWSPTLTPYLPLFLPFPVQKIWDLSSPPIPPLTLMSPSVALRLRMLSNVLILSSVTLLSLLGNFKSPKLSSLFSSMAQSPKMSQVYSPAQITLFHSLHETLRQIFQIKSPYYHRVLNPSDAPCKNEFLSLAYPVLPTLYPLSMKISDRRIQYLGHILRHPDSPESLICFNPSRTLRTISSPCRRGAHRAGLNSGWSPQ